MVEYAVKSGASAMSAGARPAIAGCRADSDLLMCLSHAYPRATLAIAVVLCLFLVRWLYGAAGYGRR